MKKLFRFMQIISKVFETHLVFGHRNSKGSHNISVDISKVCLLQISRVILKHGGSAF